MPFVNRTLEFKHALLEREDSIPEKMKRLKNKGEVQRDELDNLSKSYLEEAYNVLNHIHTLTRMLSSIRKPYLTIEAREPPLAQRATRSLDLDGGKDAWANIRYLSNEERDQIDIQARVILSRCAERVKEMEALEKRRAELVTQKKNPFARFLPSRLRQNEESASSDFIAAHHSSITWFLSRRLTEASQSQKEMQEERVKRQLERTHSLGSSAGYEMLRVSAGDTLPVVTSTKGDRSEGGSWLEGASSSIFGTARQQTTSQKKPSFEAEIEISEDEDEDMELTASQIMQFETENANILKGAQDTLESVQQAESRLMDISALQMELVSHLTRQTELTDQLFEDAVSTSALVEKGNAQLKEAKRKRRTDFYSSVPYRREP